MRRKVILLVTGALFLGAIIGVVAGFSVPTEKEEEVTHLTYDIEGTFDHQAYGKPPPDKKEIESNPRYFNKIINSIEVQFSYQFLPEEPVTSVTEEVTITAILDCRDWQKEVELVPPQEKQGDFSISFPLDTTPLVILAGNITEQLGAAPCTPDIILKATVHTVAQTAAGVLEADFFQTTVVKLTSSILEWDRELALSQIGYSKGFRYEHRGNFSYAISLKPNILLGAITIKPVIPPPVVPVALKQTDSYDSETTDRIDSTFTYKFTSDETLKRVINEVEVTATLGKEGDWQETFVLAPESQQTGDFSLTFPLDVPLFYAIIKSVEEETGTSTFSHDLIVTASVHTVAQSDFGPIDEALTQSLTVKLETDQVVWPEATPKTKSGSIKETLTVSNSAAGIAKMGSLGALGVTMVIFLYTIWSYWEYRHRRISRLEADDLQVKGKHQDLVVDVEKLPDTRDEETLIELGSLDELAKVAESLLKPVLRLAEPERHIYCVIDGMARYQYVSLAEEPATPAPLPTEPPTPAPLPAEPPPTDETLSPQSPRRPEDTT
ncbi:MAG TPA: DUF5305 family protein [Dehalococcoidales bacterium]|nr:DUF5305 family protein [Dehalococcoidales bacterium]